MGLSWVIYLSRQSGGHNADFEGEGDLGRVATGRVGVKTLSGERWPAKVNQGHLSGN